VRERFAREGRAVAALDHPNVVRLYDVGQDGGTHYLVMEYVEGRSLEAVLRQDGRLPLHQAVDYVMQVAAGLQHAHERGIVHRDVKPANLLVDTTGTVKILDMGLARFHADAEDRLTERTGGGILGSPDYVAPEQASHQLDTRTDVYSLGATLYALLTGEPPFCGGSVAEKIAAHRTRPVVPPHRHDPSIPLGLSQVVVRTLEKDPADRYQTPAEVIEALAPFARQEDPRPRPAPPPSPAPAAEAPAKASWWGLAAIALGLVLAALLGALLARA
jgi:serine/threonine-protein kinase